jgi:prepilin-type N-terminal cleavage/methylation domain-containing protein
MNKLKQINGFTIAELLVVVTIIGILVAVSIPIFTSQLNKVREAADLANERAAKAAALADFYVNGYDIKFLSV